MSTIYQVNQSQAIVYCNIYLTGLAHLLLGTWTVLILYQRMMYIALSFSLTCIVHFSASFLPLICVSFKCVGFLVFLSTNNEYVLCLF